MVTREDAEMRDGWMRGREGKRRISESEGEHIRKYNIMIARIDSNQSALEGR